VFIGSFLFGAMNNFPFTQHHNAPGWGLFVGEVQAWEADYHAGRAHHQVSVLIDPPGWTIELPKLDSRTANDPTPAR
jgi:hypothetical protein